MSRHRAIKEPSSEFGTAVFNLEGQYRSLILLFALILRIFLSAVGVQGSFLSTSLAIFILVAAIYVAADTRRHLIVAAVLGIPAVILEGITLLTPGRHMEWTALGLGILLYGHIIRLMLLKTFNSTRVTAEIIVYALCIYLLIGQIWTMFYGPIAILEPEAFTTSFGNTEAEIWANATYFSFVTLTTLGYGDISPIAPLARGLAVLEALTGTLFLAVLIGRLVGSYKSGGDN